ncbi:MAG: YihA family ribosome biogenesis GTP-binding protein [Bacteroidales bacterium]|nr:YihA family ribosome biogenesis GTP-binding protein [Bacteroidales bacterium]
MGNPITARFIISSPEFSKCPPPVLPEYAFIGRSNVGKSSLINMITGQKMLAKTSGTPGKTQLINHFLIDETWYLVDLPGYGYAKTSRLRRKQWDSVIEKYLLKRTSLMSIFLLVDSRLSLQENDHKVISWLGEKQLHFSIVLTKTDKLTANQLASNFEALKKALRPDWEELPPFILSSSAKGIGKDEILSFIEKTNQLFNP